MQLDVTMKGHGRMNLDELCLYEVKEGKIVSEQFTSRFHVWIDLSRCSARGQRNV